MTAITVLANPGCPHCVRVLDRVTDLAFEAGLPLSAIDVTRHPEAAFELGLETSPIVVLGRRVLDPATPARELFRALAEAA